MTWQPIETAPRKHGCLVDLWCVDHAGTHGVRVPKAHGFLQNGEIFWHVLTDDGSYRRCYFGNPTHWMPLPEPPSTHLTLDQAIADVTAGKVERVNAPGQWTVSMQDGRAVVEHHNAT